MEPIGLVIGARLPTYVNGDDRILIRNQADAHMSYVETPPNHRFPWYVRLIFLLQRRRYGRELEPARLWGRVPRAFLAMSAMYGVLDRKSSPIDPALRSLVQVRVSQINGCGFCIDINSASGLKRGVNGRKLDDLPRFAQSDAFGESEKVALRYAEVVTDSNRRTDVALVAALREHFDDDAIVELTALIAYQNMSSKFNAALGVPAQGFCAVPQSRQTR
jgi:AhpD family alkylhydroperoxidase